MNAQLPAPKPDSYTLRQLCETAGISKRTAYRLIASGQLRTYPVPGENGREWHRISIEDWEAFFAARDRARRELKRPGLRFAPAMRVPGDGDHLFRLMTTSRSNR